ncbi:unnamed protein product [Ectocarpus fasciculatus]
MSHILTCETGFEAPGLQPGEAALAPIRILSALVSATVVSAWCSRSKIKRLSLFFAHWLSGMIWNLSFMMEDMMVTVCWAGSGAIHLIKTVKFITFASSHMLSLTNLVICVNLALIVLSQGTVTRVHSISSPRLLMVLLAISVCMTAATVPLWETVSVLGTRFWITNSDKAAHDAFVISTFFVECVVGVCMLGIVVWLLLLRAEQVKGCWKTHSRVRYYFCLTLLGTAVNVSLGICSVIFLSTDVSDTTLAAYAYGARFVHVALDTFVLYGVLREKDLDERAMDSIPSDSHTDNSPGPAVPDGQAESMHPRPGGNFTRKISLSARPNV